MIQSRLVKLLLSPFSLLYGLAVSLRNFFYKQGLLKGVEFDLPIIAVGNLSVGGAGKTPHIEYMIRLLKPYINVATLSRGYKRKTKGFLFVETNQNAEVVGDEPLQYKRKFPDIMVVVAESRTFAIPKMVMERPDMQTILLDDAFQHRSIKPGLNILLTEHDHLFTRDFLLPSGRLRESRSAYKRADVIIITKCPPIVTEETRAAIIEEVAPLSRQRIYFSYYQYYNPWFILDTRYRLKLEPDMDVLLISAIARTEYLIEHLETQVREVKSLEYEDHHYFSKFDLSHLKNTFNKLESDKKIILTTEKDAMRLELHREFIVKNKLPIYVIPVQVAFHFEDGEKFDADVKDFLLGFKS